MTRYRILPYRKGSKSAKALAEALGGKVLRLEGSKFKPKPGDSIINWGNAELPPNLRYDVPVLNQAALIKRASNKLNFFNLMALDNKDIIPEFWTNKKDIPDDKFPIVCRTILAGHSGAGLVIADNRDSLVDAPLYTAYVKKKDEYRVHIGLKNGEATVICTQRKARRLDVPDEQIDWRVRNLAGGFVFAREGVVAPDSVIEAACSALRATGLDFGGVDVGYNERTGKATVYEVNTACGLEGQTVEDYANFFRA